MATATDHTRTEAQRTLDSIVSCSNLLEHLAQTVVRLGTEGQSDSTLADAVDRLQSTVRVLRSCASNPRGGMEPDREGGTATAALHGHSPAIPIPAVLSFLSQQFKTGALRVVSARETFSLEISNGDVVHAISDAMPPELRLGRLLVASGALREEQLEGFFARYHGSPPRMGEALRAEELVRLSELRDALRQQVQAVFHRLFAVEEAEYLFWEGKASPPDIHIRTSVMQLLLEAASRHDERDREQAKA